MNLRNPSRSLGQRGMSLVELMVAMIISLLVLLATIAIFDSNRLTYRATEGLGRVQENARVAFELMARDIREAGGTPCARNVPVANVLNGAGGTWWNTWGNGVFGYESGALAGSSPGTDALELSSGIGTGVSVTDHNPTSAQFKVSSVNHGLNDGDIAIVCDYRQASIFQVTNAQPGINDTVVHNAGTGTPGNCSKGLGFKRPIDCSTNGTAYQYGENSQLVRMQSAQWYVGDNGRGGRSLYRRALRGNSPQVEEVIDGVANLQLTYLLPGGGAYLNAPAVPNARWREVTAVRVSLALQGVENVGTDGQGIRRTLEHVVNLRNRTP